MLRRRIRVLLALTATAPLSVSLAYIYVAKDHDLQLAFIAYCICVLLGAPEIWSIGKYPERLARRPSSIKKTKSAHKVAIGFVVSCTLPLVFRGQSSPDMGAWVVAACMLFFRLWNTHSLQVGPVLGLYAFHFYEVETCASWKARLGENW